LFHYSNIAKSTPQVDFEAVGAATMSELILMTRFGI